MTIRLSYQHGVNPTIPKCFYCLDDKNEVLLLGRLPNDERAPRGMCFDQEPCDKCKDWMEKGVLLISVKNGEPDDPNNPYRTGGWTVVTENAIRKIIQPEEFAEAILKKRVAFVPDDAWDMMGLPREKTKRAG